MNSKNVGEKIHQKEMDPQPVTLMKRRLQCRCFPVNFAKFLSTELLLTDIPLKPETAVHMCPEKLLF